MKNNIIDKNLNYQITMHEYHLAKSVLESIIAKTKTLTGIENICYAKLKIGKLKMVSPDSFRQVFAQIAKGTLCQNTNLDIEIVEGSTSTVENIEAEFKE